MKRLVLLTLVVAAGALAPAAGADTVLYSVTLTVYTLVSEASTSGQHSGDSSTVTDPPYISGVYHSEFLYSGWGVAMQGTGIANNGAYIKYVSGGGGWNYNYTWLNNPSTAVFTTVSGVTGSSGRTLVEDYSIAVDPGVIPMGSYVWIDAQGHWYRADDTGGAIVGSHIDIYMGASGRVANAGSSNVYITSTVHAQYDPSPYGAVSPPATPVIYTPAAGSTVSSPVSFTWSPVSGIDYYYAALYQGGSLVAQAWPTSASTSFSVAGGSYVAYVWAHNSAGWSGGASTGFSVGVAGPPGQASGLSPDNWVTVGGGSVTLSWWSVAGADSYDVVIYYWNGSSWSYYYTYTTGWAGQTFWPQFPSTYYAWAVTARNGAGAGPMSNWAYFYFSG